MGRGVEDVQDELKLFPFRLADDVQPGEVLRLQLGELQYTPPEISAYILRQLKKQRRALLRCARHAGRHHRPGLLQRRAAPGHQGCGPHGRPRSAAPGE